MPAGLPGLASRKRKLDDTSQHLGSQIDKRTTSRYAKESSAGHTQGTLPVTTALRPLPQPLRAAENHQPLHVPMGIKSGKEEASPNSDKTQGPSQTTKTLDEFMSILSSLVYQVIAANTRTLKLNECCECGQGERTVTCYDCTGYPLLCTRCFVNQHRFNPLHWAKVWCPNLQVFTRCDISTLSSGDETYGVYLGHTGRRCPNAPAEHMGVQMTLVDVNGIHNTWVLFCHCGLHATHDRTHQLIDSCFFPATLKSPRTAFSFRVLKQFHLQHLESKQSAQDFCSSLQRLTDNAFTSTVSDIYEQFLVVMQVWRILTAVKRAGIIHGIDDILTHRIRGNLIVHCPSCPEAHMNMEDGWERTPPHLRHLNQSRCTCNGNHHANHYCKNTDPQSTSLFGGRSYYAKDEDYQDYLKRVESSKTEKSTCTYLNAVNQQDRKKFKNMNVTGIINIQCDHVLVKSSADMYLGERFVISDFAYAHAIRQHRILDTPIENQYDTCLDRLFSYDIGCGWGPRKDERFDKNLPDVAHAVRKMRILIPLLHVQNHKDNCMYLHACSYTPNAGHFHGETAEQYWVELNQLGPQTRQMNNGHRQDTIIDAHSHWNWKKIQNMGKSLSKAAIDARALYTQHREHFSYLSQMNGKARVEAWGKLNREDRKMEGLEIHCVYRERSKKVPSQKKIYDCLVSELEKTETPSSERPVESSPVIFVHEGLKISLIQNKIKHLAREFQNHSTTSQGSLIADQRAKLRTRIDKFRSLQKQVYSSKNVAPIAPRKTSYDTPEYEELYLPSSFALRDRQHFDLGLMANQELKLREGIAFDKIRELQELSKVLSVDLDNKRNARGVKQNTRSGTVVKGIMASQAQAIDDYNINRTAMIRLGMSEERFPAMTREDTYRKPTQIKRRLGDSRRAEGRIWSQPTEQSQGKAKKRKLAKHQNDLSAQTAPPTAGSSAIAEKMKPPLKDGWIWDIGALGVFSTQEVGEWSKEGDRVQWFRAEAEMERWREEYETRLADLLRCIRSFKRMHEVWLKLSRSGTSNSSPSHAIYACTRSEMYKKLTSDAEADLKAVLPEGISLAKGEILADYVQRMRDREDAEYAAKFPLEGIEGEHTSDTDNTV